MLNATPKVNGGTDDGQGLNKSCHAGLWRDAPGRRPLLSRHSSSFNQLHSSSSIDDTDADVIGLLSYSYLLQLVQCWLGGLGVGSGSWDDIIIFMIELLDISL